MPLRALALVLIVVGCSSEPGSPAPLPGGGAANADAGGAPDASERLVPAPIDEAVPTPIPDTIALRAPPYSFFGDCTVRDHVIPYLGADVLDACTICQCTTFGGRCSRRLGCAEDVCVFIDGTRAAPGESVRVQGCFVCTCDDSGGRCVRDTAAPCPADGCLVAYAGGEPRVVAFGATLLVSECHQCTCDERAGASCADLCHSTCMRTFGGDEWLKAQERTPADDGCGSCVCDYGSTGCDPRGCDPGCIGAQQGCR
jgi:hypothetical protein